MQHATHRRWPDAGADRGGRVLDRPAEAVGRKYAPEKFARRTRDTTLRTAAQEYIWLYDRRHGIGITEIAQRSGVNTDAVKQGLKRARQVEQAADLSPLREPTESYRRLIPLFPVGPFTPESACPHRDPLAPDSPFVCMTCHQSGDYRF